MPDALPLHDGGDFYHDARPAGFHPALRGAAQLVLAVERRVPGVREELQRLADGERLDLAVLGAPTVWFDPERGFRLRCGGHSEEGRRRMRARLRPFERVAGWARERCLHSVWVVELLCLTVASWQRLAARARVLESDLAALAEGGGGKGLAGRLREERAACLRAAAGWGPWVRVLSGAEAGGALGFLLDFVRVHDLPYLRRVDGASPAGPFALEVEEGWRFEVETWEEFEGRLKGALEGALAEMLEHYRRRTVRAARRAGYRPSPTKTAVHHFDWLVLRQVEGWPPARVAEAFGVGVSAVHSGLRQLSELLELELRPVRRGPRERR